MEASSAENKLVLNAKKCKKLITDFKHFKHNLDSIFVNNKPLSAVKQQKILAMYISSNPNWNVHIRETVKKANKRMYFVVIIKRSGVPVADLCTFFCSNIRPLLEYCSQVFHHSLIKWRSRKCTKQSFVNHLTNVLYEHNLQKFYWVTDATNYAKNQFRPSSMLAPTSYIISFPIPTWMYTVSTGNKLIKKTVN